MIIKKKKTSLYYLKIKIYMKIYNELIEKVKKKKKKYIRCMKNILI